MIEKMKKYNFLIYHKDYQDFILKLRDLGVVHVVEKQTGMASEEGALPYWLGYDKRYDSVIRTLHIINEENGEKQLSPADKSQTGFALLEKAEKLLEEKDILKLEKQSISKEIERIQFLGEFSEDDITRFVPKGWYVHLHSVTASKFNPQWVDDYNAIQITRVGSQVFFLTFTRDSAYPAIETEHIHLPEKPLSVLRHDLKEAQKLAEKVEKDITKLAKNDLETLRYQILDVKDSINLEKVELSGDAAAGEKLMLLEGYVPEREEEKTNEVLTKESIYFTCEVPLKEDQPPIKFKNNRLARAFEMVTDLYDRPNYNAFDLTPFYAPFYIVFFGLCLGDCGYGLIILLASFLLKKKGKNEFMRSAGRLATYLGVGTMIFGFISGTFFGIPLADQTWSWLQPLQKYILDSNNLFNLALILGIIQIIYAMFIKGITSWIRFGFLYSLDTFGWILVLLGNGITYVMGRGGNIDPELQRTLHIVISSIGGFMMFFFNYPERGIKGVPISIGSGLYGLYNKLTGILGDVLSYIRLFALGISGSVMGLAFNQLAVSFAPDVVILKQLVMIAILLFGHSINLFLNGLGAFIHPLRLTFVEFYNNAGFDGGGKKYIPFRKQKD